MVDIHQHEQMKVLIALDSFKGSCDSFRAGKRVAEGLSSIRPDWSCEVRPVADGGEGTAMSLLSSCGGKWVSAQVTGPLSEMKITAGYALLDCPPLAVVEMATASGLTLLGEGELQPLDATTYGTGELLQRVMCDFPGKSILLSVGGSATSDGGTGAARACGWRLLDRRGAELPLGGGFLDRLHAIEAPQGWDPPPIQVLCDVNNPLLGERGAAAVYAPQKGANAEQVQKLEKGLARLAEVVDRDLGVCMDVPGGGAAGGLAAGALAFFNASLQPGIDTMMKLSGLDDALSNADWLITGEGRFDAQSLQGKVVQGLLKQCHAHGVRVGVIAGQIQLPEEVWRAAGVSWILPLMKGGVSVRESMQQTEALLFERAREAVGWMKD